MAVSGINDSLHNSYNVKQTQTASVDRPNQPDRRIDDSDRRVQPELTGQRDDLTSTEESVQENRAGRMADLDRVALKFNREDSFGYIGMHSSLDNLDVQKAISDMQKDQVLQSYQYFVGSAGSLFGDTPPEDGMVVVKP